MQLPRGLYAKINLEYSIAKGEIDAIGPCSASTYIPRILGIPFLTAFIKSLEAIPQHILIFQGYIWLCFVFGQWREYQVNGLCNNA